MKSYLLLGLGREDIARAPSISAGAMSNIIKEWKLKLGEYDTVAFRELARALTPNQRPVSALLV
jgi:hypothetical protein